MALDSFNINESVKENVPSEDGALHQFTDAFSHEARLQTFALAQTVGLGDNVGRGAELQDADGQIAKHAQMFGRAAADLLPVVATGFLARYGFGKAFSAGNEVAKGLNELNGLLLKRSSIGLSLSEAATTGLVTGALLKPTDDNASRDLASFVADRAKSGVINAASFAVMSGLGSAASNLAAKTESTVIRTALSNPMSNGALTGAIGGVFNVELDSVSKTGEFTFDRNKVLQSAYEMSLVGGTFGTIAFLTRGNSESALIERTDSANSLSQGKSTVIGETSLPLADSAATAAVNRVASIETFGASPSPRHFDLSSAGSTVGLSFSEVGYSPTPAFALPESLNLSSQTMSDIPQTSAKVNVPPESLLRDLKKPLKQIKPKPTF